ncbi:class I glutamine amidotransferase-like protein [Karstenula rhodostoma CBS 690.94]|uniref:D-lactate dehydratase n=1 Tax=Karstenula rhodostoma CBS 690.94 TaxID=1392251 RepID=A0A9P4P8F2_9PLEO|nr:class I glutamine amidotransferase-like protein [Karstenula rhodostoma CBS 690.94]
MSPPRRALIAVTSANATLFPPNSHTTGVFIGEALHPYNVLKAAGFEVDIASEKGTWAEDWLSLQPGFLSDEERKQYDDKKSDFRTEIDQNRKAEDLDASQYGVFFASAGHAALIDYPHAAHLQATASKIWANGGVVSAVCHGPAIFPGIIDTDGQSIIKGRKITGFTTQAEYDMEIMDALRSWGEPLVDEHAKALGAEYVRADGVWDDFHVVDGRVVTGMNPQSAKSTTEAVVKVFEGL